MKQQPKVSTGKKGKMPRTTIGFRADTYKHLEQIAAVKKVSVAWVVRDAVDKYLAANRLPIP